MDHRKHYIQAVEKLEEIAPVFIHGGWVDPLISPSFAGKIVSVRLVYAYPTDWIASLAHWRDTIEVFSDVEDSPTLHIVGHEVSKWARFLLKVHIPTLAILASKPVFFGSKELMEELIELSCVAGDFSRINHWLRKTRRVGKSSLRDQV